MNTSSILVDSSAFVAWFNANDMFHSAAKKRFSFIEQEKFRLITTSYVVDETATVLSFRKGQDLANIFLDFASQLPMIFIAEELRQKTLAIFKKQKQRGTSMVDCSNVAVMQLHEIPIIFSYDEVFSKTFHLQVVR